MERPGLGIVLALSIAVLPGCASGTAAASAPRTLENTEWTLARLGERAVTAEAGRLPTLKLLADGRKAEAWTGCNHAFGKYELDGGKLKFGALATTRMACAGGAGWEPASLEALQQTEGWKIADGRLELLGPSGETLATLQSAKER